MNAIFDSKSVYLTKLLKTGIVDATLFVIIAASSSFLVLPMVTEIKCPTS